MAVDLYRRWRGSISRGAAIVLQKIQQVKQQFWKTSLQQELKWYGNKIKFEIGSLALLKEDNNPPLQWKLGSTRLSRKWWNCSCRRFGNQNWSFCRSVCENVTLSKRFSRHLGILIISNSADNQSAYRIFSSQINYFGFPVMTHTGRFWGFVGIKICNFW